MARKFQDVQDAIGSPEYQVAEVTPRGATLAAEQSAASPEGRPDRAIQYSHQ